MQLWDVYGAGPLMVAALGLFVGGFVKGAVGFALPLVAVAIAATALPVKTAVALLILPTVATNIWQVLRESGPALGTAWRRFWPMNLALCILIWISAGFLPSVDERVIYGLLAGLIAAFALAQLARSGAWIPRRYEAPAGVAAGMVSGVSGGLSGMWGVPTVIYLTALGLGKREQVLATGLAFACGSLVLIPAHLASGVLTAPVAVASTLGLIPAMLGQAVGQMAQDRMDLKWFRRATLIVLCLAGANLVRRALIA